MSVDTKRRARAAGTRSQLLATGRRLFAERGYAGTATEEIVAEAGVTRGALYYHFRNKQDLFRAVFEDVQDAVHEQVSAVALAEGEPWRGLVAGCSAYLDASLDPATQRIALIDAPSVLGWDAWHNGFQHLFGLLAMGLHWAVAAGEMEDQPVVPLAHVLLGALNEGAMYIARSDDRAGARDGVAAAISGVLAGLRRSA
jgi:AcrR family transcriptional regulator